VFSLVSFSERVNLMDIKKMIETIETKGIDAEAFVPELHHKLVKLYSEKDIEWINF